MRTCKTNIQAGSTERVETNGEVRTDLEKEVCSDVTHLGGYGAIGTCKDFISKKTQVTDVRW